MTAGTYTIRVTKDLMFFEPLTVKIAPNTPQLPDIITAGCVDCFEINYGNTVSQVLQYIIRACCCCLLQLYEVLIVIPHRFSVCGQISISRLPEGMKQQGRYKVSLAHLGQDKASSRTIDSDPQGAFCFQAKPGDYSIYVRLQQFRNVHNPKKLICVSGKVFAFC